MKTKIISTALLITIAIGTGILWFKYDEWVTFRPMREIIKNQLKDPDSTQFRNQHLSRAGWLCGELNSKNSSGGYIGYKRFTVGSTDDVYLEDHGYIGTPRDFVVDTATRIAQINRETAEINARYTAEGMANPKFAKKPVSDEDRKNEIFEQNWNQQCQITAKKSAR